MAKFAINTLEFTKVREKLSQYAGTAMGRLSCHGTDEFFPL